MKVNYHTHTYRCHHAYGNEWEYVQNAMAGGLEVLGFADHAPFPFPNGYRSGVRMLPEKLPEYIETVDRMKKLFGDRIEIYCGLETEYYPEIFPQFLEMLKETPGVEYLILGQHYLDNEYDRKQHTTKPTAEETTLIRYVDQVIAGLETGKFLYLCHPDVLNYVGEPEIYRKHMQRLCRAANALEIPLELNLQGMRSRFSYPRGDFWQIAGEENCSVVIGTDAHSPEFICVPAEIETVKKDFVEKYGLKLLDNLKMKKGLLK